VESLQGDKKKKEGVASRVGVSTTPRLSCFKMMMMVVVMVVLTMVRWKLYTVTFQLAVLQPKEQKMKKSCKTNNEK